MAQDASFCHVFLSFRGETRNKFTCFLYEGLKAEGFTAFMDRTAIRVGDEVDSTIKEGIRNSMSAIIIFSQNYAYSTWCLDELVLILERKKNSSIGARHNDKVDKWREALAEVGNIHGQHVERLQSTFIQNTVKLLREKLAAKFPECRLPTLEGPSSQGSSSSSMLRPRPSNDKVILYTISVNNGLGANGLVKKILMSGNVVFVERNCSKESEYMRELEELVSNDKVRFPMVIVNGKDLCGAEEVEGIDDFEKKKKLISVLNHLYLSKKQ
ncbi:disease resistance protein RPV1-like [Daucus carota subsp. sativus]|uniref:disease resistance protein RPV1-like n=1 Tax=Daucus carota subsp. sativus TaxID=79200 RepID=UPI003083BF12